MRHIEAQGRYLEGKRRVASEPPPEGQKFKPGTFVRIATDLGPSMKHFKKDTFAKVEHTYSHAFGGSDVWSYCLLVKHDEEWHSVAWYKEDQLTQINDMDTIDMLTTELRRLIL